MAVIWVRELCVCVWEGQVGDCTDGTVCERGSLCVCVCVCAWFVCNHLCMTSVAALYVYVCVCFVR